MSLKQILILMKGLTDGISKGIISEGTAIGIINEILNDYKKIISLKQ